MFNKVNGYFEKMNGYLDKIEPALNITIGGAARLEQQLITMGNVLDNKEIGKAFFSNLNDYANTSAYGIKEFSEITQQFVPFTKNTDELMTLNKIAERLTLLNPTQGLEGAGSALKEMLGGDGKSLEGNFTFDSGEIKSLNEAKNIDELINNFDKLLDKKGATQQALQELNNSAIVQFDNLSRNIRKAFAQAFSGVLERIKPLLSAINQGFENGSFQTFFNSIGVGMSIFVDMILRIIDVAKGLADIFINNWSFIAPIVYGVAAAIMAYNIASEVSLITTLKNIFAKISDTVVSGAETVAIIGLIIAQDGLNAALALCPLNWIIALVVGLIVALVAAIAYSDKFREGFAGAFQSVANVCANVFGAIVKTVENALNWIINKLNDFLKNVNKATKIGASLWGGSGTNFHIDNVDFSGYKTWGEDFYRNIGASGANTIRKFSAENIKKSIKDAMGLGEKTVPDIDKWNKEKGSGKLLNGLPKGLPNGLPKGLSNGLPNGLNDDSNKHLKNIDDKIDVGNEHLEMLRDLAEMESIQNFVTLTPTVQVTTGDVKEEADINKIIAKIENYMEKELVNSAEGVYV